MSKYTEQLSNLRASVWFRNFVLEEVVPIAPQVQEYAPGKTESDWKYSSGMRHGYLLALKHIAGVDID